jgi:carboxyl-terminal processing protease
MIAGQIRQDPRGIVGEAVRAVTAWTRRVPALVVLVLTLVGAAGCALRDLPIVGYTEPRPPGSFDASGAKDLFADGLDDIDRFYIEPVQVSAVALNGLGALSTVDSEFRVARAGDSVRATEGTAPAASFIAPSDHDSAGWAAVIAGVLDAGRQKSEKLRASTPEALYQVVFDGTLHDLDRFSRYTGAKAARDSRANRDGFGGIGIEVGFDDGVTRIKNVLPNTPAAKAHLVVGDQITQVDQLPVAGMTEEAVISMMRGAEGTNVTLMIVREGTPPFALTLRRAPIVPPTITYRREPGDIAYFGISSFNIQTATALDAQVERAKAEIGPQLKGVILDLRNNPGGYLDQGIDVARLFVSSGRILTTHGRHPDSEQQFDARESDILHGLPLAVLINGGSASSAEIVAAALQDLGRAVVIGSSSYGKGTVQDVLRMPNGGELILTWAKLYAPSGYALQRFGVIPNICTSDHAATATKTVADLRAGRLDPTAPLSARRIADTLNETDQLAFAHTCPSQSSARNADVDLEVARSVLSDPALVGRSLHGPSVAAVH